MAIIKCPECGHQVSDKAPTCPSCGVEIAGNIIKCSHCGEVYLREQEFCPHCYQPSQDIPQKPKEQAAPIAAGIASISQPEVVRETAEERPSEKPRVERKTVDKVPVKSPQDNQNKPPKKSHKGCIIFFISFIIALLVFGAWYYMYKTAQDNKEMEEWRIAMNSSEPLVLQGYLDTFRGAPQAHRDSIMAHMQAIKQNDRDWNNALASRSKTDLVAYIRNYPDSPHKQQASLMIDSIDWAQSSILETAEAYQSYMDEHPDGNYYDEAAEALRRIKASEVTPEEKSLVSTVFHNFFLSINTRNEENLQNAVADQLTLLEKTDANKADVVEMMNRMYKEGMTGMTWKLPGNYDIKKREVADARYEYTTTFYALQDVQYTDASKNATNKYRITSTINPDGKITLMKLTRIVE